jgi:hypothetical protein
MLKLPLPPLPPPPPRVGAAGSPLELIQPETLRFKVFEPLLLIGKARIGMLDIRIRVKGGGHVSQMYGEAGRLGTAACSGRDRGGGGRAAWRWPGSLGPEGAA